MMRVLLFATLLLVAGNADAAAGGRAALVVGIGHYASLPQLPNAVADARAIGDALQHAGFRVSLLVDPDAAALRAAVAGMQTSARDASAALFYYAGHAVQFENRNYLLAADAAPHSADELEDQGLDLTRVIMRMAEAAAAVRLIFVDACRDSPLAFTRGAEGGRGLAPLVAGDATTAASLTPHPRDITLHSATHGCNRAGTSMADGRGDESLGPKRLCKTDDYAEPTLSSRVPAYIALRDCRCEGAKRRGSGLVHSASDHLSMWSHHSCAGESRARG
jgi:hypothetical protein